MQKHHLLPDTLVPAATEEWLRGHAVESFKDERKILFSDDDINAMARQSSGAGAEIIGLKDQLKEITDAVNNGHSGDTPLVVTIYPTNGVKALDKQRSELDKSVKMGYSKENREIFGLPDADNAMMVYFDGAGNHIEERDRPFSAREKHQYQGMFAAATNADEQPFGAAM